MRNICSWLVLMCTWPLFAADEEAVNLVYKATEIKEVEDLKFYKIFNDKLYYVKTQDSRYGSEWFSQALDPEVEEELLKDIYALEIDGIPSDLAEEDVVEFNGRLYFLARSRGEGIELWSTDGSNTGTTQLVDLAINDGDATTISASDPKHLRVFGNQLIFFIEDPDVAGQLELWITDGVNGAEPNTQRIFEDDELGLIPDDRLQFLDMGEQFYFVTRNSTNEYAIWRSNGGTELDDTYEVTSVSPESRIDELAKLGNEVYYFVDQKSLFKTTGEQFNEERIRDIRTSDGFGSLHFSRSFNNQLIMAVSDDTRGRELWKSDGTTEGTELVKEVNVGTGDAIDYNLIGAVDPLTEFEGNIFLPMNNGSQGVELWRSDGTADNTLLVENLATGTESSNPRQFFEFDGDLYFIADHTDDSDYIYRVNSGDLGSIERIIERLPGKSEAGQVILELFSVGGVLYFIEQLAGNTVVIWRVDSEEEDEEEIDSLADFFFGGSMHWYGLSVLLLLSLVIGRQSRQRSRLNSQPSSQN